MFSINLFCPGDLAKIKCLSDVVFFRTVDSTYVSDHETYYLKKGEFIILIGRVNFPHRDSFVEIMSRHGVGMVYKDSIELA